MGKTRRTLTEADWALQAEKANAVIHGLDAVLQSVQEDRDMWRTKCLTKQKQLTRLRNHWWRRLWWTLRRPTI